MLIKHFIKLQTVDSDLLIHIIFDKKNFVYDINTNRLLVDISTDHALIPNYRNATTDERTKFEDTKINCLTITNGSTKRPFAEVEINNQ